MAVSLIRHLLQFKPSGAEQAYDASVNVQWFLVAVTNNSLSSNNSYIQCNCLYNEEVDNNAYFCFVLYSLSLVA